MHFKDHFKVMPGRTIEDPRDILGNSGFVQRSALGLVAVYNRLPIIYLYDVWSTLGDSSSLLNLHQVIIRVLITMQSSISNFFKISIMYLVCEMKIPFSD